MRLVFSSVLSEFREQAAPLVLLTSLYIIFFFSSRRRHTRCLSDWSSDVCSSDLSPSPTRKAAAGTSSGFRGLLPGHHLPAGQHPLSGRLGFVARRHPHPDERGRSEERRVGKECRCRWWE